MSTDYNICFDNHLVNKLIIMKVSVFFLMRGINRTGAQQRNNIE